MESKKKGLRVGIIGARGIGKYHAREFRNAGTEVVANLGKTKKSSRETSSMLEKNFGIETTPYFSLDKMILEQNLDLVSICTPPELHEEQTRYCLERGLHVLCEKPFISGEKENYRRAERLLELAEKNQRVLNVNTQWASLIKYLKDFRRLDNLYYFGVEMEPSGRGKVMLEDHLPHMNSLLLEIFPDAEAYGVKFLTKEDQKVGVSFSCYSKVSENHCRVDYFFETRKEPPGKVVIALDGNVFRRKIGKDYSQSFSSPKVSFAIEDPLRTFITRFVNAVEGNGVPLVGKDAILRNIALSEKIMKMYNSSS